MTEIVNTETNLPKTSNELTDIEEAVNIEQILNYFKDINYINSNIKNVLESYMEVYLTATSFEDIDNISNFYISEVSNSSLTEIEKEALLCSFLVGANSPHFWLQSE